MIYDEILEKVKDYIVDMTNSDPKIKKKISEDDIIISWECKTLQHYKFIVVTTNMKEDRLLFEVKYDGNIDKIEVTTYKRIIASVLD